MKGFYSDDELINFGFKKFGKNILISKDARIFNPESLSLGDNVRIDAFCVLTGKIEIGSYVHIGNFSLLSGVNGIIVGNFSALSSRVSIFTANADFFGGSSLTNPTVPKELRKIESGNVILEDHCLVGSTSVILPPTHLKQGVVIGAQSLLKGTYTEWYLYAGSPAKKIKKRPKEKILKDAEKLMS